jgi:hypothetical protein
MFYSLFYLHMTISRCGPWFGSAWSSSEWSGLARSASLLQGNLKHLSAKFKGKNLVLHLNKYCIQPKLDNNSSSNVEESNNYPFTNITNTKLNIIQLLINILNKHSSKNYG